MLHRELSVGFRRQRHVQKGLRAFRIPAEPRGIAIIAEVKRCKGLLQINAQRIARIDIDTADRLLALLPCQQDWEIAIRGQRHARIGKQSVQSVLHLPAAGWMLLPERHAPLQQAPFFAKSRQIHAHDIPLKILLPRDELLLQYIAPGDSSPRHMPCRHRSDSGAIQIKLP